MSLIDSFYVGIFGMTVVFAVLLGLMFIVQIQSSIYNMFTKSTNKDSKNEDAISVTAPKAVDPPKAIGRSQLELIGVDEKTAAMIIAIVSDESKIPPEQMDVKYIKAID